MVYSSENIFFSGVYLPSNAPLVAMNVDTFILSFTKEPCLPSPQFIALNASEMMSCDPLSSSCQNRLLVVHHRNGPKVNEVRRKLVQGGGER